MFNIETAIGLVAKLTMRDSCLALDFSDDAATDFAPPDATPELHWTLKRRPQSSGPLPRQRVRPASSSLGPSAPAPLQPPAAAPAVAGEQRAGALHSLWVGRFSAAADIGALPMTVRKGQKLGSVRALGIDWPVLAPAAGVLRAMLADDASVVEYGQALVHFVAE